jgi:hypothetical protein
MNKWTAHHQHDNTYFVIGPRLSPNMPQEFVATVHGDANARLIEKAPDILEVLKFTLAALENASPVVDAVIGEEYAYQGEIESARALIEEIERKTHS